MRKNLGEIQNYLFLLLIFVVFSVTALYLPHVYFQGITFASLVILAGFYIVLNKVFRIRIPFFILVLIFIGVLIDALGNFFDLYGKKLWFFWYDEMSHLIGTGIVGFSLYWLLRHMERENRMKASSRVVLLLAFALAVTFATLYEVTELWDEVIWQRARIWGEHDTARDLQWDIMGATLGVGIGRLVFRGRKT